MKTTVLVSAAAALFVLYMFEYQLKLWSREYKYNVPGSFNRFVELSSQGEQILPLLLPTSYAQVYPDAPWLPLSAPAGVWMLGTNEYGYWPKFKTDEMGFNNPPGAYRPNPDVILIGDSMVPRRFGGQL